MSTFEYTVPEWDERIDEELVELIRSGKLDDASRGAATSGEPSPSYLWPVPLEVRDRF